MTMKIIPYVSFNGECAEAVAFYEKVFNVEAQVQRYKDAPKDGGFPIPEGAENFIMHAQFELGSAVLMLSDTLPDGPVKVGENISLYLELEDVETAKVMFDSLKEGGEVSMELEETFFSKYFGSLTDKFGIVWNISLAD